MKIKQNLPYDLPAPVEPALEANEAAASHSKHREKSQVPAGTAVPVPATVAADETPHVVRIPAGSVPPLQLCTSLPHKTHISDAEVKREFVRAIQLENQNFEIQARNANAIFPVSSNMVGLRADTGNGGNGNVVKARYEIPDDHNITRTAAKIIGNRKELEMREILASRKNQANADSVGPERSDAKAMPTIDPSGERRQSPTDE